ncbi:MAG: hypothetical protein KGK34_01450 [Chloroflexota bacterium]|nr:hypothetical protein [Chloroflexota bacterium]
MIGKLLSLLSTAKGAAAVTVVAAAAVGGGVVATNTDIQDALGSAVQNITHASPKAEGSADASGQPAVVAARNTADKKLRDAFQNDQQKLEKLRGTKVEGADRGKLNDIVKTADDKLRARLDKALNDVAALTLGREGLVNGAGKPSGSPGATATATATPTATPTATATATTSVSASATPKALASFSAAQQAQVDAIVTAAIADMDQTTADAEKAVAALPTANPGKPSDAGKPSGQPGAKPSDAGKPSDVPGGKPSDAGKPTSHP